MKKTGALPGGLWSYLASHDLQLGFKQMRAVHQLFLWCNKRMIILLSEVDV